MWRWNKILFCFWLTKAAELYHDTVQVNTEILWYSLGKYGWNDNEDKQQFNTVIIGKAAILKMYKDTFWHTWMMKRRRLQ